MVDWRTQAAEGRLQKGATFEFSRTFSQEELLAFGQLTRDYNPVHYEPRWHEAKGFDAPICHGLLVGSMICEPGGQLGWLATGMSFRFLKPVFVGDRITCRMDILEIDERYFARARCSLTNQDGELVISGDLEGFLPTPEEQELLAAMLDEGDESNLLTRQNTGYS